MRALFLDFDGVIINRRSFTHFGRSGDHAMADPSCVAALNRITDETGASIVISSTWRIGRSLANLATILKDWQVAGDVFSMTPNMSTYRGVEISEWLRNAKKGKIQIDKFLILDDNPDMHPHMDRLVQTEFNQGLTMKHAIVAIRLFETLTMV